MVLHTEPQIDIENDDDDDDDTPKLFPADTETRRVAERYAPPLFRPNSTAVEAMRAVETALRPEPERPLFKPRRAVLAEREKTHGDFNNTARVAQRFKAVMRDTVNWDKLTDVQREVLESKATKIARILSGDPNFKDHWLDDAGFSGLVEERL